MCIFSIHNSVWSSKVIIKLLPYIELNSKMGNFVANNFPEESVPIFLIVNLLFAIYWEEKWRITQIVFKTRGWICCILCMSEISYPIFIFCSSLERYCKNTLETNPNWSTSGTVELKVLRITQRPSQVPLKFFTTWTHSNWQTYIFSENCSVIRYFHKLNSPINIGLWMFDCILFLTIQDCFGPMDGVLEW